MREEARVCVLIRMSPVLNLKIDFSEIKHLNGHEINLYKINELAT